MCGELALRDGLEPTSSGSTVQRSLPLSRAIAGAKKSPGEREPTGAFLWLPRGSCVEPPAQCLESSTHQFTFAENREGMHTDGVTPCEQCKRVRYAMVRVRVDDSCVTAHCGRFVF